MMKIKNLFKLAVVGLIALCMPRSTAKRQAIPATTVPEKDAVKIDK